MALSGILTTAGNATTNPNPNTLVPSSPFPTPYIDRRTPSSSWPGVGKSRALSLRGGRVGKGEGQVGIPIEFICTSPGATYSVLIWKWNQLAQVWVVPSDYGSITYTGDTSTYIDHPDDDPIYIQLTGISSGNIGIYYDNGLASLV